MSDTKTQGAPGAPKTAPADADAAQAAKLVACTVAPRRTVMKDGKRQLPGAIIHLPAAEVLRLRELGFLTNPGAPDVEVVTGDMPKVVHGS